MPPWELAEGAAPTMWGKKGVFSWNDATYKLLGDPTAVELLYNEEEGKLGFRGVYYGGAILVRETEDLRYSIDATEYLDDLGLDLPNNWEASPEVETEEDAPGIPHQDRIVWITIPE